MNDNSYEIKCGYIVCAQFKVGQKRNELTVKLWQKAEYRRMDTVIKETKILSIM